MSAVVHPAPAARWRPTPLVAGSIGLHGLAALVLFVEPEAWLWAFGAVAGNHAVLTLFVLWPRSTMLGPNLTRLPEAARARGEIALTFDDGPDAQVTPRVLELLEARGARATFFCIAEKAARHPDIVREIARRGHAVENHSSGHQFTFAMLGMGGIRKEIGAAQGTLAEIAGKPPRFFRSPAGFRSPLLDPVLHAMGLRLVTWTRRGYDTRRCDVDFVARRLERGLAAGDILLLHDGHSARTSEGAPVVLEVLPRLLDAAQRQGLRPVTLSQAVDS
jgi:peptidoglycan/xylan/chitin deacetylase (PgdA/CDA1 family)